VSSAVETGGTASLPGISRPYASIASLHHHLHRSRVFIRWYNGAARLAVPIPMREMAP
jgi:hypothetical protein